MTLKEQAKLWQRVVDSYVETALDAGNRGNIEWSDMHWRKARPFAQVAALYAIAALLEERLPKL